MQKNYYNILILFFLNLFTSCDMHENKKLFTTAISPDSTLQINVYYEEPFVFGAHTILIYGKKATEKKEKLIKSTELSNDGANLKSSNIVINWTDNQNASLSLTGKEQPTTLYHITSNPKWDCSLIE
jgi:hypothetical protein